MAIGILRIILIIALAGWLLFQPQAGLAGEADVLSVEAQQAGDGSYRFDVTVRHADEGWDHYANAWQIVGPDGKVLATRELAHPHVDEQPFTRSLSGVRLPDGISRVTVRARDSRHGLGGREMTVELPGRD